jgi:hypothetical protein
MIRVLEELNATYSGKIPEAVFKAKCKESNFSESDIEKALSQYASQIVKDDKNNSGINDKVREIIKSMKSSFPERIPYDIFSKKCLEMGIPMDIIEAVVHENRGMFLITVSKTNDYGNILIILIYHCLKKIYPNKSASQYYGICLERGLTVNDIRFAESATEIVVPDMGKDSYAGTSSDTTLIEAKIIALIRRVKKEYQYAIPVTEFLRRWDREELLAGDVDMLIKIYTYYLLSSYNDHRMTKEKSDAAARIKTVNAQVFSVLKDLSTQYGNTIPHDIFRQKCKEYQFSPGELEYSINMLNEYKGTSDSFDGIKFMDNKAYLILTVLRKKYPGKIPYNIFYQRCKAIGLTKEEIIKAVHQCGVAMFTGKIEEEPYLRALDDMILKHKANSIDIPPPSNT